MTEAFYHGDVLFYTEYTGKHFVVATLHDLSVDDENEMLVTSATINTTVVLDADTLVAPAGQIYNSDKRRSYVFWDGMILGDDTQHSKCGSLDFI